MYEINAMQGMGVSPVKDDQVPNDEVESASLTDAFRELMDDASVSEEKLEERREAFKRMAIKHRDDAVRFRMTSGIEQQWAEDQAYYEGHDTNALSEMYKGLVPNSPLIAKPKGPYKSKVFLNITRPYVETAASKAIEVLAPVDDRAFEVKPAPLPLAIAGIGQPQPQPVQQPQAQPQPGNVVGMDGQPVQQPPQAQVQQAQQPDPQEAANKAAAGAQLWIDNQLQLSDYNAELRRLVDDSARLGTGVMRGPTATIRRSQRKTADSYEIVEEVVPTSKCVPCWNIYPDPACGDDIHRGQFIIERDTMVDREVRALVGLPGYSADAIAKVLECAPQYQLKFGMGLNPYDVTDPVGARYEVWYYYGNLTPDDAACLGLTLSEEELARLAGTPACVTFINDEPVRAHIDPLVKGRFPYDLMPWQRTAGSPWGNGICRQIRACQSILNNAVRSLMENSGLASGPQIIMIKNSVKPADGVWEITPRKLWYLDPDADVQDVQKAFNSFHIDSVMAEMLELIKFSLQMAENVTGLPILLQGQQGPQGVPETVGGMQILVANASSMLRRIARIFDDCITRPHVTAYYDWMMLYGEDDSIKGNFYILARGSSALVTKDMRATFLQQQVPQFMQNPAFGIDPTRYFKQMAKLNGLDPADVQYTPDEVKQLMQQAQDAPPPEKVQVAQITADAKLKATQMDAQIELQRIQRDTDRDTAYVTAENQRTQTTMVTKMAELELRRELAMLDYANKHQMTLEEIKAKLAIESGKNDLQRELSVMGRLPPEGFQATDVQQTVAATPQVASPAVEPPGKAPAGHAYEQ